MKTAVINIKVDPAIKRRAQERARSIGVSLSSVLQANLASFAQGESFEFPAERMTPQMEKVIGEADADIRAGRTEGPFTPAEFSAILKEIIKESRDAKKNRWRKKG